MKLGEIVRFRKDLLFNGAVQVSWCETDPTMAEKAAEHFVFHGPDYHGVSEEDFVSGEHKLVDTASFTLDLLERVSGKVADEPFTLSIAGYGTGKSHYSVTLSSLLSNPNSELARKIIKNISSVDTLIGKKVEDLLNKTTQPYLVVTINGMQDFDLSGEIIRQVLRTINNRGFDSSILENLRPRFKSARNFVESFFIPLKDDFIKSFGPSCTLSYIVDKLKSQDEETFSKVSDIYEEKMGSPIRAVGQESLHDFIRVTKEKFCGNRKPFSGILIIFDEFGRYLEFAVQKPHIAGSGALQQLFECVQANSDGVFLLCFIQYELKAYISRVAPELRDELNRYVTRYESIRKVRLSTNLETLIANLLEKKNSDALNEITQSITKTAENIQKSLKHWLPDLENHAVWMDEKRFERVICKGCWPLHPLSTWVLYKLSSIGKSLQQRSALSLLDEAYEIIHKEDFLRNKTISPVQLCSEALINEFLASERYGQQGATAHAYENVLQKYQNELSISEKTLLKAVLMATKTGIKSDSREEFKKILLMFSGLEDNFLDIAVQSLESEFGVLEWNDKLHQYEIAGDAVPKRAFLSYLSSKVDNISSQERAAIFNSSYSKWLQLETFNTDFAADEIPTKEWNYRITCSDISLLESKIDYVVKNWKDARGIDEDKGQLIYCYVGPESKLNTIMELSKKSISNCLNRSGIISETGIPLAIVFLEDKDGRFGQQVAEYWAIIEKYDNDEKQRFNHFILDKINSLEQDLRNTFSELERERHILFATEIPIEDSRIKNMLTELFDKVYPKRIPFPFDGFNTIRGNAAKDCQLFTRELLLGNLDRDWISAREEKQKNRAYDVLVRAWGALDEDGSIRVKPSNKAVREIIELIERTFEKSVNEEGQHVVNFGEIMRVLCAPPYGLNIASAGLVLSLYIGKRKNFLAILKNGQSTSIEIWLQEAMPRNFFELLILDLSQIMQISTENLSEWEILLDDWSGETTYSGKIKYQLKAQDLDKRVHVPENLHYKYVLICEMTKSSIEKIKEHNNQLNSILERIERATEAEDAGKMARCAADLLGMKEKMQEEDECWTNNQIQEIDPHLSNAIELTRQIFPKWYKKQSVSHISHLQGFQDTVGKICSSLKTINLENERKILKDHAEKVSQNIRHFAEVQGIVAKIDNLISSNRINDTITIATLNHLTGQVGHYKKLLEEASQRTTITQTEISAGSKKLTLFETSCTEQISKNQERVTKIYDISIITSLSELQLYRNEVSSLINIYQGQEQDVNDLKMVLKQLDLMQTHFSRLLNDSLSEDELNSAYTHALEEIERAFIDDAPPLDTEVIYSGIIKKIQENRMLIANEWMKYNVPEIKCLADFEVNRLLDLKRKLQNPTNTLSKEQIKKVKEILLFCENRVDEFDIDGLIGRFKDMSREKRQVFLRRLVELIDDEEFRKRVQIS